ncbi:glutamate synthase-related protein [Granulicella cerasi]|uniref:glutamate synthase-related protein n=1 Tax=Granulicella cerasi TaxID=741063 RepID=UPI0021E0605C|nr:glutamate synthase-related protein [Granulicella cerasi]
MSQKHSDELRVRKNGAQEQPSTIATRAVITANGAKLTSLVDPIFDHDSCGVGFVASALYKPSRKILEDALTALSRLAHRGAVAADGKSSDGVGVMTGVPRKLLLESVGIELADDQVLGVGMLFTPPGARPVENVVDSCLRSQELEVLCWREVPIRPEALGEIALSTMPVIRQVLVKDAAKHDLGPMERRLYLARKQFERAVENGEVEGYFCSLSSTTLVYKSMCEGKLLPEFFVDLQSPAYTTPFAIFHQRYATNTLPAWHRAQPGRKLGHNGEINTVWGNRARMDARDSSLPVECKPVLTKDGTDSTSLDETIELISQNGRTIAEAVRMLLPPAMTKRFHPFLKYHQDVAEPWDGPAAIAFSDGVVVGAALDRNGLRPCRYAITSDGLVVAGSEAGLVDLDPATVIESGRLGPGEMLGVDMSERKIYHNDEMLDEFDVRATYVELAEDTALEAIDAGAVSSGEELQRLQKGFGYTKEDVNMILKPMAATGKDAVWSMGDDTPLAFLAKSPRPLYAFFRQRFAQVTNPAIDPLRESVVVSLHSRLGPWAHMLDKNAPLPGLSMDSPFLSLGQMAALRAGAYPHKEDLRLHELSCTFTPNFSLEQATDSLAREAVELVRSGVRILVLTDRGASESALPVPMAMATGMVHEALVAAGLRTLCGIAVEAGDARDVHHMAVLLGYGAGAICPWLALETAGSLAPEGTDGEAYMLKSLDAGIAKIMSKMGISVVNSYRCAHLFDILGLHRSVVDRCFPGTPAPLSGVGFAELDRRLRMSWNAPAVDGTPVADLADYGWVRFRKSDVSEPHKWAPLNVKALQTVMGSTRQGIPAEDPASAFQIFSRSVDQGEPATLRELLEVRPAGPELALEDVEKPDTLCHRFIASAMSLGSLSPEAHQTITAAMNMIGARSNTGEGGEDPAVYRAQGSGPRAQGPEGGAAVEVAGSGGGAAVAELVQAPAVHTGVSLNNRIKQIASGRFGVTAEYLAHAEEIEIKVAQGAKPGEGGQLPGHKVSGLIARLRHAQPGVGLISPPPHHDIYSIEDLAQLIYDLKRVNPKAAVGVKLVSSMGVGTVAAGVAKAYADFIVIAGNNGGTGAAALSSIKYAGNPWELGLAEAQQLLRANGMRGRVRLRADGGLSTARDVLIAALLGADEYAFGTAVLVALGCDMARQCHLNTCPTGIATQKPELRAKFRGKPEHVVVLFQQIAADLQKLLAKFGLRSLEEAIGRVDLLEQVRFEGNLDLTPVLAQVGEGPTRWEGGFNTRPGEDHPIDEPWVAPAIEAAKKGEKFYVKSEINNEHRSIGARLAGEAALLRVKGELDTIDATFDLEGTAGQSFGAFAGTGNTIILTGQANDFVGKGLSGADLIIRPVGRAAEESHEHVLLGNVALYGATAGRMFAAGRVGERFAVRNSGVTTVVEGAGDHACEYMTGGTAVILGRIGINFGAGMTGGTAWVWDIDGDILRDTRYHTEFLEAVKFDDATPEQQAGLHALVKQQKELAHSKLAEKMLAKWPAYTPQMVLFVPKPQ